MKQRVVLELDVEQNETLLNATRRLLKDDVSTTFVHPSGDEKDVVVQAHRERGAPTTPVVPEAEIVAPEQLPEAPEDIRAEMAEAQKGEQSEKKKKW